MDASTTLSELLSQAADQLAATKPLLPTYSHLLISALFPIYAGAHASLTRPSSAAQPKKKDTDDEQEDEDDEEEEEGGLLGKMEGLEPSDALMFPLMAGLTLGGLYLLIKWLQDPAILNKILSWYFMQAGITFAISFLKDVMVVIRSMVFPSRYSAGGLVYKVNQEERSFVAVNKVSSDQPSRRNSPLPGIFGRISLPDRMLKALWGVRGAVYRKAILHAYIHKVMDVKTRFGALNIVSCIISLIVVSYFTFIEKTWYLTNFLGFSFAYSSLQFLTPTTFWTGSLLLSSLFFYDIYFVFFTPLMVTVATKLDIPVKLLFPRPSGPEEDPDIMSLAMLGLGDVVIPGMMIGLALRFDIFLHYYRKQKSVEGGKSVVKPQYRNATGGWGERFWTTRTPSSSFPEEEVSYREAKSFTKTYFYAGVIGYTIGMIATLLVMQFFQHAQPALLYLVPGVLISLWGTAFFKGDIKPMWGFYDATDDEEEDEKGEEKDKKDKKEEDKSTWQMLRDYFMGSKDSESSKEKDTEDEKKKDKEAPDGKDASKSKKDGDDNSKEQKPRADEDDKDLKLLSFNVTLPKKKKQQVQEKASVPETATEKSS
ncbi:hypothetical protein FQN54_002356 [Arachnomyces sp. PD_36]|nr:hypothetical protein FQN54_002356 [Arachnomyces sp. PD_36]